VILCTFYTPQYFDNFGSALVISGRISETFSKTTMTKKKFISQAEFLMDGFLFFSKSSKTFLFEFFISTKSDQK
jgi:hypothetical protein